jgi:hypothetical protein
MSSSYPPLMPLREPGDDLDYTWDWHDWLAGEGGDTIASAAVSVTQGDGALTVHTVTHTPTAVQAWAAGGTPGTRYLVGATITTAAGRVTTSEILLAVRLAGRLV